MQDSPHRRDSKETFQVSITVPIHYGNRCALLNAEPGQAGGELSHLSMAETNCAKWRRESVPVGLREKGFEARCYFCFLVLI
jgi:hypothetical protein